MALRALEHLDKHPDRRMVLLAGSGHVRKGGIPAQIKEWRQERPVVILTETPGVITADRITPQDADYLLRLP